MFAQFLKCMTKFIWRANMSQHVTFFFRFKIFLVILRRIIKGLYCDNRIRIFSYLVVFVENYKG